jgi:hypothetical protein
MYSGSPAMKPSLLLPAIVLFAAPAFAQRPHNEIKGMWSWKDRAQRLHDGSFVVAFTCGPVASGTEEFPERDPNSPEAKWTKVYFWGCGDSDSPLAESVHLYLHNHEVGVDYATTDSACAADSCLLFQRDQPAQVKHSDWNGHPYSFVVGEDQEGNTEVGWFIVLNPHTVISLVLHALSDNHNWPDDFSVFSHSLAVSDTP